MTESHLPINSSRERAASSMSGYLMLLVFLGVLAAIVFGVVTLASGDPAPATILAFLAFILPAVVCQILIASGFYMIQPNQAVAVTLFGSYRGTDREADRKSVV